jgi:ketosteroid isomerase-like protein
MNNVSANRKLAEEFCGRLSSGDIDKVMAMFAEDACVRLMMRRNLLPLKIAAEYRTRAEIRRFFVGAFATETPHHACRSIVVEGNRLAIETVSDTELPGGYRYTNNYVFMIEAEDGKIVEMREYMDTLCARAAMEHLLRHAGDSMQHFSVAE